MKMLRDWNGDSLIPLKNMLAMFGIETTQIGLCKYEVITPDSFIWVFNADNVRYCLYAEDYVSSMQHVINAMNIYGTLSDETDSYELLPVTHPEVFTTSSPVASASVYKPPADTDEFMQYAATSGYDFVFLGQSTLEES